MFTNLAASYPHIPHSHTITDSPSSPSSTQNPHHNLNNHNQKEKMSVASSPSFPCIKLHTPSSSSSSSAAVRFTIRSSQADGPFRRPTAPTPVKPVPPSPSPPAAPKAAPVGVQDKNVITLEFQRQKAKELQEFFKQKKLEKVDQGPFFGFIAKNEISNGRWAMFGFAVGMLTEYATGSDFVDQVKILLSNFGILDLD